MTTRNIIIKLSMLGLEVTTLHKLYIQIKKNRQLRTILDQKTYRAYLDFKRVNIENQLREQNIRVLTIEDEHYPEQLKHIYRPPIVLYYMGNINLLNNQSIAVIGSRKYSVYGKKVTEYLTKGLIKNKIVIISGLAYGIDTIAHLSAIKHSGKTISVIGSGFMHVYPKDHKKIADVIAKDHLLISEYPPHEKPKRTHFVFRNRLISALSQGVLVIEAKERSGTMITVDYALNQGKQIYTVPANIFEENSYGTNLLIKDGCKVVTHINDILEDFS